MSNHTRARLFPQIPTQLCGVYCIRNTANGKRYIGSSANVAERLAWHANRLAKSEHPNKHLQSSWSKHGDGVFEFLLIEETEPEHRLAREQYYLDTEKPEYNLSNLATGSSGVVGESTRQKHSANSSARWANPEYKSRLSAIFKRVNAREDVKQRKRDAARKRMDDPEARARASESASLNWSDPEFRRRISQANKGKKPALSTRIAVSEANKRRIWSDEQRLHMAEVTRRRWAERKAVKDD